MIMKKQLYILIALLICSMVTQAGTYSGGDGSTGNPYQIANAADLVELSGTAADWTSDFVLTADIDMTGQTFNPIGTGSTAATSYTGHFDGDGYVVNNLTVTDPDAGFANGLGMFGAIIGATIENLGLENINVTSPTNADERVAGIVGYADFGTIQNCYVKGGTIQGKYRVASIVGWNKSTNNTVTNCWSSAAITYGSAAWHHAGGIVGTNDGIVTKCLFYGSITDDVTSNNLGGIVGTGGGTVTLNYYIDTITEKGNGASAGSTALTTAELVVEGSYVGFDFVNTWVMDSESPNYANLQAFSSVVVQKPTIAIDSPADGSGFSVGDVINISATATPNASSGSAIASVTYDIGSGAVAMTNSTGNTWTGSFTSTEVDHTISVTATDGAGEFSGAAVSISAAPTYSGGDGSTGDPYQIANAADLMALSGWNRHWDKDFIQTADIDMAGEDFKNIGTATKQFTGNYNGQSNTISNLTISTVQEGQSIVGGGLFGVANGAELINIGLINPEINLPGQERVGGIVGELAGAGSVDNCFVLDGFVRGNFRAGGVIGYTPSADISNVFASCQVIASTNAGGVIGQLGWDAAWAGGSSLINAAYFGATTANGVIGTTYSLGTVPVTITGVYYIDGFAVVDANSTAVSLVDAKVQGTFTEFDFATPKWEMESGCYPILSSFSNVDFSGLCDAIIWDGTDWSNTTGPASGSDDVIIAGTLNVSSDMVVGSITVPNGGLTVASGASLAIMGVANGFATITRNTTGNAGYSILGAPVSGEAIEDLAADYAYTWDGSAWTVPTGTMTSGVGYFVGYDVSTPAVAASGQLVHGDVSVAVSDAGDAFNIVANPYAAAISISSFLAGNSDIASTVYLWNDGGSNVGGDRGGDYVTVNNVGSVGSVDLGDQIAGLNNTAANTHIGTMQGFLVEANTGGGTVSFTPAMQDAASGVNADANFYRDAEQATLKLALSGAYYSEVLFGFREDATISVDRLFDAVKKVGNDNFSFYSMIQDGKYAIQGLPALKGEQVISMGYEVSEDGMYELSIKEIDGINANYVVIANYNGQTYNLSDGAASLSLVAGAGKIDLVLASSSVLGSALESAFTVYNNNGQLNIRLKNAVESGDIRILDIAGRTIVNLEGEQFDNKLWSKQLDLQNNKVYILKVVTAEGTLTQKFIF